jgi:hypothetical protein
VCVVCAAPCLVELDLISGPRSDPIYFMPNCMRDHIGIFLWSYIADLHCREYSCMCVVCMVVHRVCWWACGGEQAETACGWADLWVVKTKWPGGV